MTDNQDQPPRSPEAIVVPYVAVLFFMVSLFAIWQVGAPLADLLRLLPAKTVTEAPKGKH
jgi:hypothetical protein